LGAVVEGNQVTPLPFYAEDYLSLMGLDAAGS
jgi:hypothetical protein